MSDREEDIFSELQHISFLLGDLEAIRRGEYEPPRGHSAGGHVMATPDDIYARLEGITGHLERVSVMMYVIGEHLVGPDWQRKIGEG